MIEVKKTVPVDSQTTQEVHLSWAERQESLKAGGLGAIAAGLLFSLFTLINTYGLAYPYPTSLGAFSMSAAIAGLSGFLFAVTYRYIIRHDQNVHLKSGAVAAFGLVRGFAQLDIGLQTGVNLLLLAILLLESVLLFAGIQVVLDWAIAHSKLKQF
jgi:hypothetical protein